MYNLNMLEVHRLKHRLHICVSHGAIAGHVLCLESGLTEPIANVILTVTRVVDEGMSYDKIPYDFYLVLCSFLSNVYVHVIMLL